MSNDNSSKFDEALQAAFELDGQYKHAVRSIDSLVDEFGASVARMTDRAVSIALLTRRDMTRTSMPVLGGLSELLGSTRKYTRTLGDDEEDAQYQRYVVARSQHRPEPKILWEIEVAESGYPVTFRGPPEDAVTSFYTLEDLEQGFIDAARHGIVGRKIVSLRDQGKRVLTESPAAEADPEPDSSE